MDLKSKIDLDKNFGRFLVFLLAPLAAFFQTFTKKQKNPKVILITKYQGMGSLMMAAPAIQRLKSQSKARFIFLGTCSTVPLAQQMSEFDRIEQLDDQNLFKAVWSFIKIFLSLRNEKIEAVVDLEFYSNIAALLSLSLCRNNFGFWGDISVKRSFLYKNKVKFNPHQYVGLNYWSLLELVDCAESMGPAYFDYSGWNFTVSKQRDFLNSRYIVVNINASSLSYERKWPKASFEIWIKDFLQKYPNHFVYLIGHGESELEQVQDFIEHPRILKRVNQFTIKSLLLLMKEADLVVSNDSAPLHFAQYLNVKAIGLFGPTQADHFVRPDFDNCFVLQKRTVCSPCVHHWEKAPCNGHNVCMKQIEWSDLARMSDQILNEKRITGLHPISILSV